jgi:hypothetical protein
MIIIWGSYYCGKCDEVPRICHVETHFGHLYYIPLIPMGSVAVFGRNPDGSIQGIPLGLSIKSVLMGWLRAACIVGAIACTIGAIAIGAEGKQPIVVPIFFGFMAVACVLGFIATKRLKIFTRAGYNRAIDLARRAGVTPEGMLMIEVAYGRLTPEQADMELQKIEQQQEQYRLEQERLERERGGPSFDFGQAAQPRVEISPQDFNFK